jgi:hypothetical protein
VVVPQGGGGGGGGDMAAGEQRVVQYFLNYLLFFYIFIMFVLFIFVFDLFLFLIFNSFTIIDNMWSSRCVLWEIVRVRGQVVMAWDQRARGLVFDPPTGHE